MTTKTQTIAGHEITLETGKNYIATRPAATRRNQVFTVTIIRNTQNAIIQKGAGFKVRRLSYDQANDLINAFNNGDCSFSGRDW